MNLSYRQALDRILEADPRYHEEAYAFVREGLDFTVKHLEKPESGPEHHVRGQELLEGLRAYALQQFGPMAYMVLTSWGVHRCEDLGEIVFNLVNASILGKTEEDSLDDFRGGYGFHEAFRHPYLPRNAPEPVG